MNELLQKHGCANVFTVPEGLRELMSDITREVLRAQPPNLHDFIANYLSVLIITREHGIMAVKILDDLCDCRPTVTEHLEAIGITPVKLAATVAAIIQEEIEKEEPKDGNADCLSVFNRGHGIMAVKILDDLCDCRPTVTEHLEAIGITPVKLAATVAAVIQEEIEKEKPKDGKPKDGNEKVSESHILKKILQRHPLDEVMTAKVCQIARNAYRDYWYRKRLLKQSLSKEPETPWEVAAAHTLEIYKRTKPSFAELTRATERIQAAYKAYHVRRKLLGLQQKPVKPGPDRNPPGKPIDIAGSREITLGRVITIKVRQDNVAEIFDDDVREKLGIPYDTRRMLTHVCVCDDIEPPVPEPESLTQESMPKGEPNLPMTSRISFAPTAPLILAHRESDAPKVEEEPALEPAKDMDASDDEIDEDLSGDQGYTEDYGRTYSDTNITAEDASYSDDEEDPYEDEN